MSRSPDSEELDKWVNDLSYGFKTRAEVAYDFIFSKEFKDRELSNADFLIVLYRTFIMFIKCKIIEFKLNLMYIYIK